MDIRKTAESVMEDSAKYGNYATFQCDCGEDFNGSAYTYVGFNESETDKESRIHALAKLIEHAEYGHISPATIIVKISHSVNIPRLAKD